MQLTFQDALFAAAGTPELVKEFDRLWGSNLQRQGSPIELAVDDASGRTEEAAGAFIEFVYEYIWLPYQASLDE